MTTLPVRWTWLPLVASVIGVLIAPVVVFHLDGGSAPVGAQEATDTPTPTVTSTPTPDTRNTMAVDADPSTEVIDPAATRNLTEEFDVSTDITAVGTRYGGYQMSIEFDDSILAFVPVGLLEIEYTGLGMMVLDLPAVTQDDDSDGLQEVYGGSARTEGTTGATGRANFVRFRCIAHGASPLHLLTQSESADFYTVTQLFGGGVIATTLQDSAITCSQHTPTPTPTSAPAVGGIAELPALTGSSAKEAGASAAGSGWWAGVYLALVGGLAAAAIAIAACRYPRRAGRMAMPPSGLPACRTGGPAAGFSSRRKEASGHGRRLPARNRQAH